MEDEEFIANLEQASQSNSSEEILEYLRNDGNYSDEEIIFAQDYLSKGGNSQSSSQSDIGTVVGQVKSRTQTTDTNDEEFESMWIVDDNPNEIQKVMNMGVASGILGKLIDSGSTDFEKISYYNKVLQDNQSKEGDVLYSDSLVGGFALDVLRTVPQSFISMAVAAPSAIGEIGAGALAGSAIPIPGVGSLAGAFAGFAGGTSYAIEYANSMMSALQEAGVDTSNAEALESAFSNPTIMDEARSYANKRGIPVALFDAVSGGAGGKIAGAVAKSSRKSLGLKIGEALPSAVKRKAALAEVGAQAILGGSGELSGQVVAGDEINVRDILLEGFAELAPASPGIIAEYVKSRKTVGETPGGEAEVLGVKEKVEEQNQDQPEGERLSTDEVELVADRLVDSGDNLAASILSNDKKYQGLNKQIKEANQALVSQENLTKEEIKTANDLIRDANNKIIDIKGQVKRSILSLSLEDQSRLQELSQSYNQLQKFPEAELFQERSDALMTEIKDVIAGPIKAKENTTAVETPAVDTDTVEDVVVEDKNKIYHTTNLIKPLDEGVLKKSTSKSDEITMDDGKKSTASDEVYFTESPDWDGKFSGNYRLVFDRNKVSEKLEKGTRYKEEKELVSKEDVPLNKDNGLISIEFLVTSSFDYVSVSGMLQDDPRWIDADGSDAIELELAKELLTDQYKNTIETRKTEAQQQANKYGVPVILKADPVTEIADVTISPEETVVEESVIEEPVVEEVTETSVSEDEKVTAPPIDPDPIKVEEKGSVKKYLTNLQRKFQDKFIDITNLQAVVQNVKGKLGLNEDFRNALTLMDGQVINKINKVLKPQVEKVSKNLKKIGLSQERFDRLLLALHAQERNAHILKLDSENLKGSGITNEEAQKILIEEFNFTPEQAKDPRVADIQDVGIRESVESYQEIIKELRASYLESGIVSEEALSDWSEMFNNYTPLQGFEELNEDQSGLGRVGRGFRVSSLKKAKGRNTKAAGSFSETVNKYQEAIIQGGKNKVLQKLYNLVEKNPLIGPDNSSVWQVKEAKSESQLNNLVRESNKKDSGVVKVLFEGKYKFIEFSDPRMAETMKGFTTKDAGDLAPIVRNIAGLNRFLSSMITTYDPEFIFRNFTRDVPAGLVNLVGEQTNKGGLLEGADVKNLASKVLKNVLPSVKAIFKVEGKKGGDPIYDDNGTPKNLEAYYSDFVEDGAKTGWVYSQSSESLKQDIDSIINETGEKGLKKAAKAGQRIAERVNGSVENAVRLSAYTEARKAGVSREKAAELAKELTVNFNRTGEYGTLMNSFYLFFNASIQGTSRLIRTLKPQWNIDEKTGKKKVKVSPAQKMAIGLTAFGGVMSLINESLSEDDDDGESYYSKVPQFVRERNIVIMKPDGKDYYKIPLPYGLNVFYVIGNSLANAQQGITKKGEVLGDIFNASAGSFSPLNFPNSSDPILYTTKMLTPTIGQPVISLIANENYFGRTIFNENNPYNKTPKPDSELGRGKYKNLERWTKALNKASGGSEFIPGEADMNPDKAGFILEWFTGGAGKTIRRAKQTAEAVKKGSDLEARNIPFYRVFVGETNDYQNRTDYYNNLALLNQLIKESKEGNLSPKDIATIRRMEAIRKNIDVQIRAIRKQRDNTDKIKDEQLKEKRLDVLEDKEKQQIVRFEKSFKKYKIEDIK